nr:immunoglobulin gamma heavy chain [Bos taurus]
MSSYAVSWVRQAPGKALECLGGIISGGSTGYHSALKSRLSITKDNSKSEVSLSLNSVTPEDTATYYCVRCGWASSNCGCYGSGYGFSYVDAWGQGLLVTVSSASTTAPK